MKAERQELAGTRGWLAHVTHNSMSDHTLALKYEGWIASSPALDSGWGPYHFLCSFAAATPLPKPFFDLAHYFLDRALLTFSLSRHSPSLLGAAACLLAVRSGQRHGALQALGAWPAGLAGACGRNQASVAAVAKELQEAAED